MHDHDEDLIHAGDDHLAFLKLGRTRGVRRTYLPNAVNASSPAVNIPGGLALGTTNQTLVYVSMKSQVM